jgi:hypothetical protein
MRAPEPRPPIAGSTSQRQSRAFGPAGNPPLAEYDLPAGAVTDGPEGSCELLFAKAARTVTTAVMRSVRTGRFIAPGHRARRHAQQSSDQRPPSVMAGYFPPARRFAARLPQDEPSFAVCQESSHEPAVAGAEVGMLAIVRAVIVSVSSAFVS